MTRLVQQILEAAGPMPDPEAHARYLDTLTTQEQKNRLAALLLDGTRRPGEPVRFWRVKVPAEGQKELTLC